MSTVKVIGAGLAGCEAAWQLAQRGCHVKLYDMKPAKKSPAHTMDTYAELVCSNSLKAKRLQSAGGLLKAEMRLLGSLLLSCADECEVEAGGALAVDREIFTRLVTEKIHAHPLIETVCEEVDTLSFDGLAIIATGPLTSDALSAAIRTRFGEELSFFDAAAPIVTAESIDYTSAFFASRYGKGAEDSYLNCPMNKEEYDAFEQELIHARKAELHDFDQHIYEGCMPVEIMAARGHDTIRFGPLKPVGLTDPKTEKRPYAVVQLRKENREGTLYNMVGFQTNLAFPEQKRVFSMIPALKNAEFVRYGVMHKNTFIHAPKLLKEDLSVKQMPNLYFAGQITGVEGYMESALCGIVAGINAARRLAGKAPLSFGRNTMTGALLAYVSGYEGKDYQPMGANFGILPPPEERIKQKQQRYDYMAQRALKSLENLLKEEDA